jgi:hypothetical protein
MRNDHIREVHNLYKIYEAFCPPKACPSELAPSEPPAPQGSLRCDGMVGLRAESAEALCRDWQNREQSHRGAASAERFSARGDMRHTYAADAYKTCVAMLRRQMAAENKRQPEPNNPVSQPAGTNSTKETK